MGTGRTHGDRGNIGRQYGTELRIVAKEGTELSIGDKIEDMGMEGTRGSDRVQS